MDFCASCQFVPLLCDFFSFLSFSFDVPPLYATRRCSQTSPFWKSNHLIHMTLEMEEGANNTSSHRCENLCLFLTITGSRSRQRNPPSVHFTFACGTAFQHRGAVHRPGAKWGCSDSLLLLLLPSKMRKAIRWCEMWFKHKIKTSYERQTRFNHIPSAANVYFLHEWKHVRCKSSTAQMIKINKNSVHVSHEVIRSWVRECVVICSE